MKRAKADPDFKKVRGSDLIMAVLFSYLSFPMILMRIYM